MLYPPRPWTDGPIVLYHGTIVQHARAIETASAEQILNSGSRWIEWIQHP